MSQISIQYKRPNYEQIKADKRFEENAIPKIESLKKEDHTIGLKECSFKCGKMLMQRIYADPELDRTFSNCCEECKAKYFQSEKIDSKEEETNKTLEILSLGVGKDSVTELLLNGHKYDEIIFADTGSEQPETYAYLEYLLKKLPAYIREKITILSENKQGIIFDYYFNKKIQPIPARRDCTDKFKIRPIRRYLRRIYGKEARFNMAICINYSEVDRMRNDSGVNYMTLTYPLIDQKIKREDEGEIIKSLGYEVPVKSGCFFCPYTTVKGWTKLRLEHPELYNKAKDLQDNSTLKQKFIRFNENQTLDNMLGCSCFSGNFASPEEDTMNKKNGW